MISNSSWGLMAQKYLSSTPIITSLLSTGHLRGRKRKQDECLQTSAKTKANPSPLLSISSLSPITSHSSNFGHCCSSNRPSPTIPAPAWPPARAFALICSAEILFTLITWISPCHLGLSLSILTPGKPSLTTQISIKPEITLYHIKFPMVFNYSAPLNSLFIWRISPLIPFLIS